MFKEENKMKNISEISKVLAKVFGENQGRSISQILIDYLGVSKENIHWLMIIGCLGLGIIIGIIIYFVIKKILNSKK